MNIVCSTDDNFVQHCTVMLTSVLLNNENVVVWLLSEGLTEENKKILKEEVESKGGIFNYIKVNSDIISRLPMPKKDSLSHISPATYYRLLISEILPIEVHKAIYLDCDIIVKESMFELWNIDISNFAVGAVHQLYNEIVDAERLGYPVKYGYFNAGVLLINLDYWREHQISKKLIDYLTINYENILMHDQDALNAILHDQSYILPCKWNMLHFFFTPYSRSVKGINNGDILTHYNDYKIQLKKNRKHPIVIHYVSKPKPWQKGCIHPLIWEYYFFANKTLRFSNIEIPPKISTYFNIQSNSLIVYSKWIFAPLYRFVFRR